MTLMESAMKHISSGLVVAILCASVLHGANSTRLGSEMDCLREKHLAVVAAHRGQADPSAPENAMSSFRATLAAGVPFLEIDVARTSDAVLALMHDDTLDRTTTGSGAVSERPWAEIQRAKLKRADGTVLDEGVPTLGEALAWGKQAGARFEIDVKRTTPFNEVIAAVKAADMEDRVLIVTYTLEDAVTVHRLDGEVMISVTLDSPQAIDAARKVIDPQRMLGWTGTSAPETRPFDALRDAGIEPIFGTLGRPGERLDDRYAADRDPSEYRGLVRAGVVMIASDTAAAAQRAIGDGYRACLR
jgi:glycerophosphoryl diester phosphodiesterase